MTWARFDDRYDDRPQIKKAWRMSGYAVGLHTKSVTHCARHESDGLVDPEYLAERLAVIPDRAARHAVATLVKVGLYELLRAGETREVTDGKDFTVTVGPLDEDAYRVTDIFDFVDSSAYLADKRRRDAERKAEAARRAAAARAEAERNGRGGRADSARNGGGIQAPSGGPDQTVPDQTRPDQTAPEETPPAVPTAEELNLGRDVGTDAAGERERQNPDLALSRGTAS
jgi:hypothetical protein